MSGPFADNTIGNFLEEHKLFRLYLEKHDVTKTICQVLGTMYLEDKWPENPMEYFLNSVSRRAGYETHTELYAKLNEQELEVARLKHELAIKRVAELLRKLSDTPLAQEVIVLDDDDDEPQQKRQGTSKAPADRKRRSSNAK